MFFSEKRLRKLANLNDKITTDHIVDAINSIGFEVEEVKKFNHNKGIKFGHVLKTYRNPNSDKLNVCEIQFNDKVRTIQTAASNVKEDDYLIAFIPGSHFNEVEIKEKEMGKIVSEGMLISYSELGFESLLIPKNINDGILILEKVDLNLDPIEYFELDDNIIEVSILSNRSDAQSYVIFAKELAAYFHTEPDKELFETRKSTFKSNIELAHDENNLLNGIEVLKDSEFKLSIHDKFLILKSNLMLDNDDLINFSNLTLLNTGVSLRCFDAEKINSKITIKEKDEITYLNDGKNNISVLGVNVENEFLANSNSKKVFFEFSQINEKIVRDNSKKIKKVTYSSINNSRVISNGLIEVTRNFISTYFENYSQLINPIKSSNNRIKFDKNYLVDYAGEDVTKKSNYSKAIKSLEILDFKFDSYVSWPNTRHDIKNMQNIVEEIFRFYGLNNFDPIQIESKSLIIDPIYQVEKTISALGYTQAHTYTLINKERNDFNPFNFKETLNLKTFVSEEFNSIRNSIAFSLLNVFDYNKKRKIENLSLFDRGMINNKKAIMIASNEKTYAQIKSDIEKITNQQFQIIKLENDYLHPNYNAGLVLGGSVVGWIGKFNPFKIDSDAIFAEILEESIFIRNNSYKEFDQSPLKERDITFEIEKDYENELYLNILKSIDGIFSITLVSTFKKGNINKLSYKILLNEKALEKFDSIDWTDKEKIFEF